MSKVIYKYQLKSSSDGKLYAKMPAGAEIIHAECMKPADINFTDHMVVWAEVDPSRDETVKSFIIVGTGRYIPSTATHIKTWIDGPFVWHLYKH